MSSQVGGSLDSSSAPVEEKKKEKICDFYLTPRGCMKGEKCDFQHPLSPAGTQTNRICDFFLTARGCRKGDQCDFLHPQPKQPVKDKVCTYYMTPQGCIKGLNCDFLHPRPGMFGDIPNAAGASGGAAARKPCDFFLSPRGCIKGDQCDFAHIRPGAAGFPAGFGAPVASFPFAAAALLAAGRGQRRALRPKVCDFHNTARGCVKGDACDFIHQKNKVCDFYLKPQGCRKGALCDFLHPSKDGEAAKPEDDKSSGKAKPARDEEIDE
jgi:hypothetical protein